MSRREAGLAIAAAISLAIVSGLFFLRPLARPEIDPECAYETPILCVELPPDGAWLARALDAPPNDRASWSRAVWLDMPYLVAYAALLAACARSLGERRRRIASLAAIGAGLAALLDLSENVGILLAIARQPSDAHAQWIASSAHAKFVILAAVCASIFALRAELARSLPARALFAVLASICATGLGGPFAPVLVEVGLAGVAATCLFAAGRAITSLERSRRARS